MQYDLSVINENTVYDYAWRRLRRYHDVESARALLMEKRSIPPSHANNVRKQMEQLSYCLTQAYEFSQSARSSGLSTKALQAYYSITSLANVEILWSGDGSESLDRRNSRYNAHGLDLVVGNNINEFAAKPALNDTTGEIAGLFGLWRRHSHHLPHPGEQTVRFPNETSHSRFTVLSDVTSLRDVPFLKKSVGIIDCFSQVPSMYSSLTDFGEGSQLVRGSVSRSLQLGENNKVTAEVLRTIIHPCDINLLGGILDKFTFHPKDVENIKIVHTEGGALFDVVKIYGENRNDRDGGSTAPEIFSLYKNDVFFVGEGEYLNEFGHFYIGLYILGMISRYHPQKWIKEVKNHSHITQLVDEFVEASLTRAPLLILSQLESRIFVYDK